MCACIYLFVCVFGWIGVRVCVYVYTHVLFYALICWSTICSFYFIDYFANMSFRSLLFVPFILLIILLICRFVHWFINLVILISIYAYVINVNPYVHPSTHVYNVENNAT